MADPHAAWRDRVTEAVRAALARQQGRALTAAGQPVLPGQQPAWDDASWDDDVEEEVGPVARDVGAGALALGGLLAGSSASASAGGVGEGWAGTILGAARSLGAGLGARLGSLAPSAPDYAGKVGAAYEGAAGQAANVGALAGHAMNDAVVQGAALGETAYVLTWNTVGDDHVRPDHQDADGQEVGPGEPFIVGDEELMFPGDPSGSDDNVMGCRCWTEAIGPDGQAAIVAEGEG